MVDFLYYPPGFVQRLAFDVLKELSRKSYENLEGSITPVDTRRA